MSPNSLEGQNLGRYRVLEPLGRGGMATKLQAANIARQIGYPVVLKIWSPDILHKTDVGGVRVNLRTADDVRDAFDLIMYRAGRYMPDARIWGCQVQQMVKGGREVLLGMSRDPQFGPLVVSPIYEATAVGFDGEAFFDYHPFGDPGNCRHDDLQRCQPEREMARMILDQYA